MHTTIQKIQTTKQIAARYGVSEKTVRNWVHQGKLHQIKIGKTARFCPERADREIARFTISAATDAQA